MPIVFRFYEKALGLKEVRRKTASDGSFILVYMGDGETSFTLELTWLRDRKEPYDLGEGEYHLCLRVPRLLLVVIVIWGRIIR